MQEINKIIKERIENKVETICSLNDLLTGKIMFETVDALKKALIAADELCFQKGYNIISMENRLDK